MPPEAGGARQPPAGGSGSDSGRGDGTGVVALSGDCPQAAMQVSAARADQAGTVCR